MTSSIPPNRARRARIYFRLMDICLMFAAVGLADHLFDNWLGYPEGVTQSPAYLVIGIIVLIFNFGVPPLLIMARFMRDEYAEHLWQRTVVALAYIAAVAPIVLVIAAWATYLATGGGPPVGPFAYLSEKVVAHDAMLLSWSAFMLLFVGIFQFLRWRDLE